MCTIHNHFSIQKSMSHSQHVRNTYGHNLVKIITFVTYFNTIHHSRLALPSAKFPAVDYITYSWHSVLHTRHTYWCQYSAKTSSHKCRYNPLHGSEAGIKCPLWTDGVLMNHKAAADVYSMK